MPKKLGRRHVSPFYWWHKSSRRKSFPATPSKMSKVFHCELNPNLTSIIFSGMYSWIFLSAVDFLENSFFQIWRASFWREELLEGPSRMSLKIWSNKISSPLLPTQLHTSASSSSPRLAYTIWIRLCKEREAVLILLLCIISLSSQKGILFVLSNPRGAFIRAR